MSVDLTISDRIGGISICDGNQYSRIDLTTGAVETIDYAHHEIHAGSHFMYTDAVTLGEAGVQNYLITTPNTTKWAHMIFVMDGSAITTFELYEATNKGGTTLQTVGNSNRNSTTVATTTIHKGLTGGDSDGTLIHKFAGGSATNQSKDSSSTRNDEELVLKQNTKYILRVTSGTASNLTNVKLAWYEHTNKAAITLVG